MALLAKLEAAVQGDREALHLIALASRSAAEQVESGARRQQALVLLPVVSVLAAGETQLMASQHCNSRQGLQQSTAMLALGQQECQQGSVACHTARTT
jgi:hypothetical protein